MTGDEMTMAPPTTAETRGADPGSVALELAPPVGSGGDEGMPAGVARVRAFVNTREIDGTDQIEGFASPADLAAWLTAQGLLPGGEILGEDDLREAIAVREALRELLEGNAGHGVDPVALRVLRDAAARAPVAVQFDPEDGASLAPVGGGLVATLGRLFADIATATADGSWARLKVCRNDECRWAYYDASRNRSGRWCSMAGCGNRMKGRAYRERGRSSVATWGSTDENGRSILTIRGSP